MDVINEQDVFVGDKFSIIFEDVSTAISCNDKQMIHYIINQLEFCIEKLSDECNKDSRYYYVSKILISFFIKIPVISNNILNKISLFLLKTLENDGFGINCLSELNNYLTYLKMFESFLIKALDSVDFEINTLRDLRDYLNFCKANDKYDDLLLSCKILMMVLKLHNNRIIEGNVTADICKCGINGILYESSTIVDANGNFQDYIKSNLEFLKKAKSKS